MDKADELRQVESVYGRAVADAVTESESPDFVFVTKHQVRLGIEVTTLFSSNADAKLKHVDGYAETLIDRVAPVHRADRDFLSVEEFEIQDKDGNKKGSKISFPKGMRRPSRLNVTIPSARAFRRQRASFASS